MAFQKESGNFGPTFIYFFLSIPKILTGKFMEKKKVKWNFNVTEKMWKPTQNIDNLRGCEMSR